MRSHGKCVMVAFAAMAAVASVLCAAKFVAAQSTGAQAAKSVWTTTLPKAAGEPRGYVQYQDYCVACHGTGASKPGTIALQAKYKGAKPALLAERTDLTAGFVKACVREGVMAMPFFRKTEISDADLDAIAAYLTRNHKP